MDGGSERPPRPGRGRRRAGGAEAVAAVVAAEGIHTCSCIHTSITQWRVPRGGGVEGRHAHRAFELAVIIIHREVKL